MGTKGLRTAARVTVLAAVAVGAWWSLGAAQSLSVPPGFAIEVLADDLGGVRSLEMGPDGLLYAVRSRPGRIVRLDPSRSGARVEEVVSGLDRPYGLAFHDGWMYVGETGRISRFRAPGYARRETVVDGLPTGGHWTREIAFGPDGMLYVSVGSSCNVCEERDPRRAAIVRYRPDGSGETIVAEGLRNAAGLAFHPETGALWASQNERDNLSDDLPLEEINIIREGGHYGWPYCYGDRVPNPEYPERTGFCRTTIPPALGLVAHSAPLGIVFYEGDQFPEEYRGDLFVALHGSWNRSEPSGYELVRVRVEEGRPVGWESFATGWRGRVRTIGRPVYPAVGPDGSLYLSDDGAGRIYRIRWRG